MSKIKSFWKLFSGHKRAIGGTIFVATTYAMENGLLDPKTAQDILTYSGAIFGVGMVHYVQKKAKKKFGVDLRTVSNFASKKLGIKLPRFLRK